MPIIYSYPLVTSLSDSDLMLITSRDDDNELFTGSVKYETLKDSILSSFSGTDNYIPKFSQGALVNSVIYQDTDGHVGINVQPDPEHVFEVFDDRTSDPSGQHSIYLTTYASATPGSGSGGILARVSEDSGVTFDRIAMVPGTTSSDWMTSNRTAFYSNSDLDTSSATGYSGQITHDGTNPHWILGGTVTESTTHTLKVNGTSEFTGGMFLGANLEVEGDLLKIGSGHTTTFTDIKVIGEDINTGTNTIIDTYTSVALGGNPSTRYGNVVIDDRTLRLGKSDVITAVSSNTTGILNFNDSVEANSAFSNIGGIVGYFPPPTSTNNYYFFSAYSENVFGSVFQEGASPTASRMNFSTDPGLSCIGQKFDANTTNGGAMYVNASNNSATASSRGIVTFDVRHQNQNANVPDGWKLFEITSGYGQTAFVVKRESGAFKVDVEGSLESDAFKVEAMQTAPSSASDTGTVGEIRFTSDYIYVCVATDTWKRAEISTWT